MTKEASTRTEADAERDCLLRAIRNQVSQFGAVGSAQAMDEAIAAIVREAELRDVLEEYFHAMEGFAEAVRQDSGLAYPWPAQEIARDKVQAALSRTGDKR